MQAPKKIAQTDEIFLHVHSANKIADESEGIIRLSMDTKANVNIGPFSRGGYSRQGVKACDHDFHPDIVLKPFGIYLPELNENYFYFTDSNVTADFMGCIRKFFKLFYRGNLVFDFFFVNPLPVIFFVLLHNFIKCPVILRASEFQYIV